MTSAYRDRDQPIYVISIAAELAGVHPQTLRVYERKGLLAPRRTQGNSRRYSERDIELLRRIQELTNEGINLAGVMRILQLETEMRALGRRYERSLQQLDTLRDQIQRSMDARDMSSLVPFKDVRRVRRAMKADIVDRMGVDRRGGPRRFPVPPASTDG